LKIFAQIFFPITLSATVKVNFPKQVLKLLKISKENNSRSVRARLK